MKKGFTLAEILIVLFVLGVVSILTIPSTLEMFRFRMYTANFNRVTSQLTTALGSALSDQSGNNKTDEIELDGIYATKYGHLELLKDDLPTQANPNKQNIYQDFLENYMNATDVIGPAISQDGSGTVKLAWPYPDTEYINLNGQSWRSQAKFSIPNAYRMYSNNTGACGKTPQGAVLCIGFTQTVNNGTQFAVHVVPKEELTLSNGIYSKTVSKEVRRGAIIVYLDTNGPKPPNATGYDFFILQVNNDGSLSDVFNVNEVRWEETTIDSVLSPSSEGCAIVNASDANNASKANHALGCYARVLKNGGRITRFENES